MNPFLKPVDRLVVALRDLLPDRLITDSRLITDYFRLPLSDNRLCPGQNSRARGGAFQESSAIHNERQRLSATGRKLKDKDIRPDLRFTIYDFEPRSFHIFWSR